MLVLSRRPQQSFIIGHDIVITVLEVNGDTVRLGIAAPRDVTIHREEVYRELQLANMTAASPSPDSVAAFTLRASGKSTRMKEQAPTPPPEQPESPVARGSVGSRERVAEVEDLAQHSQSRPKIVT